MTIPLPSQTIARSLNLGQVLETKWKNVAANVKSGQSMKIGIALPAILVHIDAANAAKYGKVIDMLLSVCEGHDCHFIVQCAYDEKQLVTYAGDKIDKTKIIKFSEGVEDWFPFMRTLDFVVSTRIHGGMAGISNEVPTVIVPTDLRILELINAMKLPSIPLDDVVGKDFTSLGELMEAATVDFEEFEITRRSNLREYKQILESVGLKMDPVLLDIIADESTEEDLE